MATIDYKQKIKDYMNSSEVDTLYKSMLNNLFPELKESDDERIRKEIINYIKSAIGDEDIVSPWIAYLEKQGEQESFDYEKAHIQQNDFAPKSALEAIKGEKLDNQTCVKPVDVRTTGYWHVEDAEQKPTAWSEEDETVLNNLIWALKEDMVLAGDRDTYTSWLEGLKNKVHPHPKQEWSKEDENIALGIEQLCNCASLLNIAPDKIDKIRTWLKSLKERYTWRPSEEQIIELRRVISGCSYDIEPLVELETKLKEL